MRLLERDHPIDVLQTRAERAAAGHGGTVLLVGEAGIGKTVLLRAFVEQARAQPLWGMCDSLSTPRPLGPLRDVAGALGSAVTASLRGSAAQEPHEVQRRLVAPVQVLDDEHARPLPHRVEHGREDLVLRPGLVQRGRHRGPELGGDVAERAERAWGAQRVAHAPQHRYARPLGERPQHDGLADPRLAGHEHDRAPAVGQATGTVGERVEGVIALQQPHRASVGTPAAQGEGCGSDGQSTCGFNPR